MLGGGGEQLAEVLRSGLEATAFELRPRETVERIGRQRCRGLAAGDLVEYRARLGVSLEPEQRLAFPEPRFERPPRRR